jgi:hypothetical protein
MGRFLCNTLQEALDSAGQLVGGRARAFDTIIIGGGTFGCVVAEHLFISDTTRSRRILVLEAGPFVLGDFYKLKFAELRSPPGSLAKVINERLRSCMQIITLMLSAIIIYPSHQFVRVFSLRHVGPLRLQPVLVKRRHEAKNPGCSAGRARTVSLTTFEP